MTPWTCKSCGAEVKQGSICPLCGAQSCECCGGTGGVLYFNGEQERMGPCDLCDARGFIPVDLAEAA